MIAESYAFEHAPRGRHGLLIEDATDPDAQFVVDLPVRDYAQKKLDDAKDAYKKKYGEAAEMDSLYWRVRQVTD